MTAADIAVFVGLGALLSGLYGAFGWPWAAMVGGLLLLSMGARMQRDDTAQAKRRQEVQG